jgi:hypothetical protein
MIPGHGNFLGWLPPLTPADWDGVPTLGKNKIKKKHLWDVDSIFRLTICLANLPPGHL